MFDSAKALPARTVMRPISVPTMSFRFRVMHGLLLNELIELVSPISLGRTCRPKMQPIALFGSRHFATMLRDCDARPRLHAQNSGQPFRSTMPCEARVPRMKVMG